MLILGGKDVTELLETNHFDVRDLPRVDSLSSESPSPTRKKRSGRRSSNLSGVLFILKFYNSIILEQF